KEVSSDKEPVKEASEEDDDEEYDDYGYDDDEEEYEEVDTPTEELKSEEGVEDLLPVEEPGAKDDFDDLDDFDEEELESLAGVENLDEILDREGIDLTEGDNVGNIMEMFKAGFSIIEISKVLEIGVSEVKSVIDKEQG
ncbi:MAG: hypothetical protein IKS48_00005, partial [Eubacterium sp.]|nr:hypothetical protein [Eubacterium sp.]